MKLLKILKLMSTGAAVAILAGNVTAAINWTIPHNGQLTDIDNGSTADDTYVRTVNNVEATFSGWANALDGAGTTSSEFAAAHLWSYSGGLGISAEPWASENSNFDEQPSRNHAVGGYECDTYNCTGGDYLEEFILVEFDHLMAVTDIGLSWYDIDTDLTVMAYTGDYTGSQVHFNDGFQRSDMQYLNSDPDDYSGSTHGFTNAGWELVANLNDVNKNKSSGSDVTFNTGSNQVFSNKWLIGNRNIHLFGGDHYRDFFKVNLIGGHKYVCTDDCGGGSVPTPGTALLLGLGLLMVRQRLKAKS